MTKKDSFVPLSVGDHIRLKTRIANEHQSYQPSPALVTFAREASDGLILSIRDIQTGRLVVATDGPYDGYVVEMLFDNTFSPKYASAKNAPRTAERPTATPAWRRMRSVLREQAGKGELLSTTMPDFPASSPLTKLLDGWKVLKMRSQDLESLEKVEAEVSAE